ncbi:MAG: hypothetical protein ACRC2V_15595 [Xenococcaceae cyanobacterium]
MTQIQPTSQATQIVVEDDRTGLSIETLRRALSDNLFYLQGAFPDVGCICVIGNYSI